MTLQPRSRGSSTVQRWLGNRRRERSEPGVTRPFISIVGDQPELHAGFCPERPAGSSGTGQTHSRPTLPRRAGARKTTRSTPPCALVSTATRNTKPSPTSLPNARESCWRDSALLPAERANRRIVCQAAIEPHRHLVDQEDEMVGIVHDVQPGVRTGSLPHAC